MNKLCITLPLALAAGLLSLVPSLPTAHAAQNQPPEQAAEGKRRHVVAALGDSITDTRIGGGRYMKALSQACPGSRFDAYGVGGQATRHILRRARQDLFGDGLKGAPPKPAYTDVVVLAGVNDITGASGYEPDPAHIEANLSAIYAAARSKGARVIALTVPPWEWAYAPRAQARATDEINRFIASRVEAREVDQVVDVRPLLTCGNERELCKSYRHLPLDRIHWNDEGHRRVAAELRQKAFADCL